MGYGYVTVGWRSHDERYSATIGICFTRRLFDVNNFAGSPALVEECALLSAVLDIICIVIAIVIPVIAIVIPSSTSPHHPLSSTEEVMTMSAVC